MPTGFDCRQLARKIKRKLVSLGTASFCVLLVVSIGEAEWPDTDGDTWHGFGTFVAKHGDTSSEPRDSDDGPPSEMELRTVEGEPARTVSPHSPRDRLPSQRAHDGTIAENGQRPAEVAAESPDSRTGSGFRVIADLHTSPMPALRLGSPIATDSRNDETTVDLLGGDASSGVESDRLLVWSLSGRRADSYPRAEGEVGSEIEYNNYFAATDTEFQRSNWLSNVHLDQTLSFSRNLKLESKARVVLNSDGGDPRFYSDYPHEGLYLVKLRAEYSRENLAVFAGKYEPGAGLRGHGPIFFGNYTRYLNLDGRIGGGASVTLGNTKVGHHTLSGHMFRIDRSRLRGEIFSNRWREDELLAGAGPLGWPTSYLLTLDGKKTTESDIKLGYTVAAGEQKRGMLYDEHVAQAALTGEVPTGFGALQLSLEGMRLRGVGGYPVNSRMLGTSLGVATPSYFIGTTYTLRRAYDRNERTARLDHIGELVGRYVLSQRTTVEAAYQHVLESGEHENAFGVVIKYSADWIIH